MKKLLSKFAVIISASLLALFTSCSGVIFADIREEVKLTDAQISGDVYTLARHTAQDGNEYIYSALGKISKKNLGFTAPDVKSTDAEPYGGQWESCSKPADMITGIISNSSQELYAIALTVKVNDDEGEMQASKWAVYYSADDGSTWNTVTIESTGEQAVFEASGNTQKMCVFGTNTPKLETRAAFANLNGTIYKLNGGKASEIAFSDGHDLNEKSSNAATFDGSDFWFSDKPMTSNATYRSNATYIYKASGSSIYYNSGASWSEAISVPVKSMESIAYSTDHILAGTIDGFNVIVLSADIPTDATGTLKANASSTLSNAYIVKNVLAVDPSTKYGDGDIYASMDFESSPSTTSAAFQNVGLWAFYPGRGKWNRE